MINFANKVMKLLIVQDVKSWRCRMNRKSEVIKDERDRYYITCATCGNKAISFGYPQENRNVIDEAFVKTLGSKYYLYQGITGSQNIPAEHVNAVIMLLEANKIKELNRYLVENCSFFEGLDAYCYRCNRVYCRDHYEIQVVMSDDFPGAYDCTMGICPRGHKRKIDD